MLALIACVSANVLIAVCFKMFVRKSINSFAAIVVNYWVCMVLGSVVVGHVPILNYNLSTQWVPYGIVLGILFVSGFNIAALSVRYTGVAVTAAMQKMSLIISAAFTILFFHESTGFFKIGGIVLSVLAIVMINHDEANQGQVFGKYFIYPLITLLLAGVIESILYHVQATGLSLDADAELTTFAFSVAAILGALALVWIYLTKAKHLRSKDIIAGVLLGIPNFFSIYLILVLLQSGYEGSVVFPILNISVLVFSVLVGYFAFQEQLSRINMAGILVTLGAILAIMLF